MNLSDFNRYAEDFEEKKKGGLNFDRIAGIVVQNMARRQQRRVALLAARSQVSKRQMAVGSTAVASTSSIMDDLAFNGLGEMGPLSKGRNDE